MAFMTSCTKNNEVEKIVPKKDTSGKPYFDDKTEFVQWTETEVEFKATKKLGDFMYTLQMISSDQMAMQELRGDLSNKAKFDEAKSHYSELLYFKLNISNDKHQGELLKFNLESQAEYSERIKYCAFNFNKDLELITGIDTVPCALHEYERTFNLQTGLNFLLAFPKRDFKKGATVALQDRLFENGIIKFFFKKSINDLPYFKIK